MTVYDLDIYPGKDVDVDDIIHSIAKGIYLLA